MAAVLSLVFTLSACGGESISRQSLISGFQDSNPDASAEQAGCVVDDLMVRYSSDELESELTVEPVSAEFEEAQFRAMFTCGVEGDVQVQITDQLVANGVSEEDAPCVATELMADPSDDDIDVLLSGEITDAFYSKFFDAMESCGAVG